MSDTFRKYAESSSDDFRARVDEELKRCLDHAAEGLHWVGPDGTMLRMDMRLQEEVLSGASPSGRSF
jgi:hypothetical protein